MDSGKGHAQPPVAYLFLKPSVFLLFHFSTPSKLQFGLGLSDQKLNSAGQQQLSAKCFFRVYWFLHHLCTTLQMILRMDGRSSSSELVPTGLIRSTAIPFMVNNSRTSANCLISINFLIVRIRKKKKIKKSHADQKNVQVSGRRCSNMFAKDVLQGQAAIEILSMKFEGHETDRAT